MANTLIKGSPGPTAAGMIEVLFDHDGPASYTTGGETITAASLGYKRIVALFPSASDNAAHVISARFSAKGSQASAKLVWVLTGGVEVANAVALNGRFCRVRAIVM